MKSKILAILVALLFLLIITSCGKVKHEVGGEAKVAPIEAHVYYSIDPKMLELIEGICNSQSATEEEYYKCIDKRVFEMYELIKPDKNKK